jgi:hypothetical protein
MQKWEYLIVVRKRGLVDDFSAMDWICYIWERGNETGREMKGINFINLLGELGDQGWELTVGLPRSDQWSEQFAGFTSSEIQIFKRPKE